MQLWRSCARHKHVYRKHRGKQSLRVSSVNVARLSKTGFAHVVIIKSRRVHTRYHGHDHLCVMATSGAVARCCGTTADTL